MRVLIVEPDLTGHHAPYLHHLIRGIVELGQEPVVLTSQRADQTTQFRIHLKDVSAGAVWDDCLTPFHKLPRYAPKLYRELIDAAQRHRVGRVWIPYADSLSLYFGARASVGWKCRWPQDLKVEGLQFRSTFAYPAPNLRMLRSRITSRLFIHRANWDILHFLDPLAHQQICSHYPKQSHSFRLMPDPVECIKPTSIDAAREQLGLPQTGCYVGYLGVMADYGCVERLLKAFHQAKLPSNVKLLLAGPMTEPVRACMERDFGDILRSERVIRIDRNLNVDEVMLGVFACDLVCIPAKCRIGSSSFLIRAAAAGRPVLGDDFGWTGWAIERFDLGWSTDVGNVPAFSKALELALEKSPGKTRSPAAERFVRFHSAENFKAHWAAGLREQLGLPPAETIVPWEWVLDDSSDYASSNRITNSSSQTAAQPFAQ